MSDIFREKFATPEARRERIRAFGKECLASMSDHCLAQGVTLEIGCGHGHWLTAYAEMHMDEPCIGIDLNTKRIEKGNKKREKRNLPLLFFFKVEAMEFLDNLPEEFRIKRTVLMFPDPWPKKRHHKRRLVQKPFLDLLANRSVDGAEFCIRTDHLEYFEWAKESVREHPSWAVRNEAPWPFEHESFFQNILHEHQSFLATLED